jgi:hypothetical protein
MNTRAAKQALVSNRRVIYLRSFKKTITETLPVDLKVVKLILEEPDMMSTDEFLAKSDVWQKLLAVEIKGRSRGSA